MKTVKQLLAGKGDRICSVAPGDNVLTALTCMAENNVGSVLVIENGTLVGIFTERDYARKVVLKGKASKDTPVRELMTEKVYYISPSCTAEEAMALVTEKRVRHLPVLDENKRLLGIVSIGDLVKETISEQQFIIEQLEAYITR